MYNQKEAGFVECYKSPTKARPVAKGLRKDDAEDVVVHVVRIAGREQVEDLGEVMRRVIICLQLSGHQHDHTVAWRGLRVNA